MDEDDDLLSEEEKEIGKNSTATLGGNSSAPTREHNSSQGGFNQQPNSNKQITEQSDMHLSTTLDRHLEPTIGLDTEHLASSPSILLNGLNVEVSEQSKYMDNQVVLTPFLGTCLGWQDRVAVRCGLPMRMVADEGEVECD